MWEYRIYIILGTMTVTYWFIKAYLPEIKELSKEMSQHFHWHLTHHQHYWWE